MRAYIIRRLLLIIPTMLLVTMMVFLMVRFIPGDVIDMMLAEMGEADEMTTVVQMEELRLEMRHDLGLDVVVHVQYGRWLGLLPIPDIGFNGLIQGNLGRSMWDNVLVTDQLKGRIPVTLELGVLSILIAWIVALPIGIYSAIRQDSVIDYGGRSFAIAWVAAPNFWLATMVIVYPAIWWSWMPPITYIPLIEDPIANIGQFLIPSILTGTGMSGGIARYSRTMMLEVLRQDYIRTSWSKGLRERTVVIRHAFRNALIPLVTIVGQEVPQVISGSVIMETIFVLPGVGRYFFTALGARDYPVISGVNTLIALIVVSVNLIVDISYAYLDPRIRYR